MSNELDRNEMSNDIRNMYTHTHTQPGGQGINIPSQGEIFRKEGALGKIYIFKAGSREGEGRFHRKMLKYPERIGGLYLEKSTTIAYSNVLHVFCAKKNYSPNRENHITLSSLLCTNV